MIVVVPLGGVVESGVAPPDSRTSASRWCASAIANCRSVGCRWLELPPGLSGLWAPGLVNETTCVREPGVTFAFAAARPQPANKTEPPTNAAATDLAVLVMSCKAIDETIRVSPFVAWATRRILRGDVGTSGRHLSS